MMNDLPFELFIAFRYLLAKRKQAFIALISFISVIGVMVGVMAVLIAGPPPAYAHAPLPATVLMFPA